jgi:hypothetical protein
VLLQPPSKLPVRVQTQSFPECDECCEGDSGQEVPSEFVVAGCDAPEVLEAAEGFFDEVTALVALGVVANDALAIRAAGNDRDDCALAQMFPQAVGIVSFVSE